MDASTSIRAAIEKVVAREHREHRSSVEAAAMALLMPIGIEQFAERVVLEIEGSGLEVLHRLLVDGEVAWEQRWDPRLLRWSSEWQLKLWKLRGDETG